MNSKHFILADARWSGNHGIGRYSREILSRLEHTDYLSQGPSPLSFKNIFWLPYQLYKRKNQYKIFFSPGFIPPLYSPIPFVFTIHDLIHLYGPHADPFKKIFYEIMLKPAIHRAKAVLTVSEYSKNQIVEWSKASPEKIYVAYNGISTDFSPHGKKHQPGYPYFIYVGNTKPHKNVPHLLKAFAKANIDVSIKCILVSPPTIELNTLIQNYQLQHRIIFASGLTETLLAEYYRGAIALLFPSLYEGFGLPVIEAMASGTPVITSNVTALPEIAGTAAITINPLDVDALAFQIEQMVKNNLLRNTLIARGLTQAAQYSWDQSAKLIKNIL